MTDVKFPIDAGQEISNSRALSECEAYRKKYPGRDDSFILNTNQLLDSGKQARSKGANGYYFMNCLSQDGTRYHATGFLSGDGRWIDTSPQAITDFERFKESTKETAGTFWGFDKANPRFSRSPGNVSISYIINSHNVEDICTTPDMEGGKDGGTSLNGGITCPFICPGDD